MSFLKYIIISFNKKTDISSGHASEDLLSIEELDEYSDNFTEDSETEVFGKRIVDAFENKSYGATSNNTRYFSFLS